jgi:hypothetical protein
VLAAGGLARHRLAARLKAVTHSAHVEVDRHNEAMQIGVRSSREVQAGATAAAHGRPLHAPKKAVSMATAFFFEAKPQSRGSPLDPQ